MRRTIWTVIVVLAGLAACASEPQPEAPPPPTNIVMIIADDLGYGDLGSYGQKNIQTPNLDRLASEGLRLTDFYAGSTVCAPSRATLMTGLHTGHVAIRGNSRQPLPDDSTTIAEVLQQAGYRTGMVGKWGLGEVGTEGEPNKQGFDHFFGYLNQRHAHNYYTQFLFRNGERVPLDNPPAEPPSEDGSGYVAEGRTYSHNLIADEGLRFLEESAGGPFFLAATFTLPHANNEGRERGMEVPELGVYADKDWPDPVKGHAAMVSLLDADVGRMLAKLDELGISENTLVFFSSDNGPHREGGYDPDFNDSNGPLRGIKRDLYEGGVRVPTLVRWPGHTKAGTTSDQVGAFWDLPPTFAQIAGTSMQDGIDGRSLVPVFEGGENEAERTLYWEFHEGEASKQAVRRGKWKAVRLHPKGEIELYDLSQDIGEENDVAAEHPDAVEELRQVIETARSENENWPLRNIGDPRSPPRR